MSSRDSSDHFSRIEPGEMFSFLCHKKISCFTHCCRELELGLTPYDMLRLRHATRMHSAELHATYVIEECSPEDVFPRFYLTMVDDGRASCVFVNQEGCTIYQHRPGACRTYPLGRGTVRNGAGLNHQFVLLREPHCHGFAEKTLQTVKSFMESQELEPFNRFNDLLTHITQHQKIREGMRLSQEQVNLFRLTLYDLDSFRDQLKEQRITSPLEIPQTVFEDDEALLEFGMQFTEKLLFNS